MLFWQPKTRFCIPAEMKVGFGSERARAGTPTSVENPEIAGQQSAGFFDSKSLSAVKVSHLKGWIERLRTSRFAAVGEIVNRNCGEEWARMLS